MWNRFLLTLVFLLYFPNTISGQTIDEDNPIIVWEPIPNATSYQLQIRNEEEEIILAEEVEETSYKLNLDPGNYSHRVGVYNKFKKISSFSEWVPFTISRFLAPEVTSEKKIESSKKDSEKIILISGKNFYKGTVINIKNDTGLVPISKMKLKKGVFELTLDNQNAKPGTYDLIMENPRKKILVIKNYYVLQSDSFFTANVDSSYPYWKEAGRSVLLPGWGQVRKRQIFSALFLDMALVLSAGYYKSRLDNFGAQRDKYNQAVIWGILYQEMKIQGGSMYGVMSSEEQFEKAAAAANSVSLASILVASVYTLNILDALLWKMSIESSKAEISFRFYTKLQVVPVANGNSYSNSSQIELGFRFSF